MEISATDPISSTMATTSSGVSDALKAEADFDTFLKLLTAQLENQDPLQPMASTEFVAQLAQFSAVEQQIRANLSLESIVQALSGGAGLADWLGKEVLATAPARFEGSPVEIRFTPEAQATTTTLIISTPEGREITRLPVDSGATSFAWAGQLSDGGVAEHGVYSFKLEQLAGREPLPTTIPQVYVRVTEARVEDGAQILVLDGAEVNASSVSAVRL